MVFVVSFKRFLFFRSVCMKTQQPNFYVIQFTSSCGIKYKPDHLDNVTSLSQSLFFLAGGVKLHLFTRNLVLRSGVVSMYTENSHSTKIMIFPLNAPTGIDGSEQLTQHKKE